MPCEPIKAFPQVSLEDFNVELVNKEAMFTTILQSVF